MSRPWEVCRVFDEAIHKFAQLTYILRKFRGRCAAGLLVQLWSGLESLRPRNGCLERNPFEESARTRNTHGFHFFQTHIHSESVAQVTNHLMRRHFPPPARTHRVDRMEPGKNFFFVSGIEESLHVMFYDAA